MGARKIIGISAAALALLGAGIVAGSSIAGSEGERREAGDVLVAEPIVAEQARSAKKGKKKQQAKPVIKYFQAPVATVPPEGQGLVQPIVCPKGAGEPVAGGAQTTQGLVVNYLSRVHPWTQKLPRRTYFVGVEDISSTNAEGSGALVEVQCAKRIKVDYGR